MNKLLKIWEKNQSGITFLAAVASMLILLSKLPYLSILLSAWMIILIVWIVAIKLFTLKSRSTVILIFIFLLVSGVLTFLEQDERAKVFAYSGYYLFVLSLFQMMFETRNEKK